jgi:hypothetical protein
MKRLLNEVKRLQQLAGINEGKVENINDFKETNVKKDFSKSEIQKAIGSGTGIKPGILFQPDTKSTRNPEGIYKIDEVNDKVATFGGNTIYTCTLMKKIK